MGIIVILIILVLLSMFILDIFPILSLILIAVCIGIEIWKIIQNKKISGLNDYKKLKEEVDEKINRAESLQKRANEQVAYADQLIAEKHKEIDGLDEEYKAKWKQKEIELAPLLERITQAENELAYIDTQVFVDDKITSEEYKNKLSVLQLEEKELIKSSEAIDVIGTSEVNGALVKADIKQILRCFNAEAASIASAVEVSNVDKMRTKLIKSFETINSIFKTDGISLNKRVLELKLDELNLIYSYKYMKEQEKEEQKAIREQMIEEEKARREIEREKAKIDKETTQFKNELNKLIGYMQKADTIEKQIYVDKIKELEEKLKLLEKDKENVLQREQNTRAGYVYVISNIGSFGENIYKIGMTRRLEPMDRIKELGDASVPFEFDVHAMIFSEDAPELETILHNTFRDNQVNKVNSKKEFFKVSLNEIEKVVKENYNATVTFTHVAEAAQYRESLRIEQSKTEKGLTATQV